jgi:hypothetical protein
VSRYQGANILKHNQRGTLGGWLTDDQGKIYLLSCWHCLDGEQLSPPSRLLIKHEDKDLATLVGSVNPELNRSLPIVDAAIAELIYGAKEGDFILKIGEISKTMIVDASTPLPLLVRMYGAASGLVEGSMRHYSAKASLDMPSFVTVTNPSRSIVYEQQLLIFPITSQSVFSQDGDSGALVVTGDNRVVGMLVGGTNMSAIKTQIGLATPIESVIDRLKSVTKLKGLRFLQYPN